MFTYPAGWIRFGNYVLMWKFWTDPLFSERNGYYKWRLNLFGFRLILQDDAK